MGLGGPVRWVDPTHYGAVWCEEHKRWECSRPRSKGRGDCHSLAISGLDVCRMHGGKSGEELRAAGAAEKEAQETRKFIDLRVDAVTDPVDELAKLAGVVKNFAEKLTGRIEELSDLTLKTESGSEQVRAVVGLWERMVRQSEALLTSLARLGLEDRAVRLEEQRQELVVRVIHAALGAMLERVVPELREGDGVRLRAAWPVLVGEVVPAAVRGELASAAGAAQDRRSGANGS